MICKAYAKRQRAKHDKREADKSRQRGLRDFLDDRLAAEYEAASGRDVQVHRGRFYAVLPCGKRKLIACRAGMPYAIIRAYCEAEAGRFEPDEKSS